MSSRAKHLSETSLYVDDLETSRAFYQRLFALPLALEDAGMVGLELPGSAVLLLFSRDWVGSRAGGTRGRDGGGAHHLRFDVPDGTLQEWERHLMLHGVAIESHVRQGHGGMSLYFRDPDGHSLEMATSC